MEADVDEEGATTPLIYTNVGKIGTRSTVANSMYQAGTPVPRAHENVAMTTTRKGTRERMQEHMLKPATSQARWPTTKKSADPRNEVGRMTIRCGE